MILNKKNKDINSTERSQTSLQFEIITISQNQIDFSVSDATDLCQAKDKPNFKFQRTNLICSIAIKPCLRQIIKNQFYYQLIPMDNAKTYQN